MEKQAQWCLNQKKTRYHLELDYVGKSIPNKQLFQLKLNLQKVLRLERVIKTERFNASFVLGLLAKRVPASVRGLFSRISIYCAASRMDFFLQCSLPGVYGGDLEEIWQVANVNAKWLIRCQCLTTLWIAYITRVWSVIPPYFFRSLTSSLALPSQYGARGWKTASSSSRHKSVRWPEIIFSNAISFYLPLTHTQLHHGPFVPIKVMLEIKLIFCL